MLIKKTIVLSDGASAIGHLSIIRVGQETGLKLVLSAPLDGCYLAIKLSGKEQENFKVSGSRGEYSLSKNLDPNDQIGALIVCEDGIIASGGIKGWPDVISCLVGLGVQCGLEGKKIEIRSLGETPARYSPYLRRELRSGVWCYSAAVG